MRASSPIPTRRGACQAWRCPVLWAIMSTATVQQIGQDLAAWLGVVRHGETVAITEQGRIVARLTPPDAVATPAPVVNRSMADWLAEQDERMQRTFGNRIVADSAAVLDDQRGDRT